MIKCKVDLLSELKKVGFNTSVLRKNKIMGEATLQKLRKGGLPSWAELNKICTLLDCQPGDLMEYVPDSEEKP